jgi:hypothetical protein
MQKANRAARFPTRMSGQRLRVGKGRVLIASKAVTVLRSERLA